MTRDTRDLSVQDPPGAWPVARRLARTAIAPVERFLTIEAASGIILLVAALLALLWANSPWAGSYAALWHVPLGLHLGPWSFERDLHFWINDGLMTIFFFVVGLEIRRELDHGELSTLRRATLPLAAALGGMIVPAAIFLLLNAGRPSQSGWGTPMATDIAFAVGVLALLGKRVPPALRVLLLAIAVIDDIGAIVVIAVFYSAGLHPAGFALAGGGVIAIVALQLLGVRSSLAYVPPAIAIWAGAYWAGIHPTLAGVIVGLMTPARAWFGAEGFAQAAGATIDAVREKSDAGEQAIVHDLHLLDQARREAVSPVERIQHSLHGWVAYAIMPLFALANAGVPLGALSFGPETTPVLLGVAAGLLVGKPIGITAASWIATRLGVAALPRGVTWPQVALVGTVASIGFTMAIFISALAFPGGALLEAAKLAILCASGFGGCLALLVGRLLLPATCSPESAPTAAEAEASTVS